MWIKASDISTAAFIHIKPPIHKLFHGFSNSDNCISFSNIIPHTQILTFPHGFSKTQFNRLTPPKRASTLYPFFLSSSHNNQLSHLLLTYKIKNVIQRDEQLPYSPHTAHIQITYKIKNIIRWDDQLTQQSAQIADAAYRLSTKYNRQWNTSSAPDKHNPALTKILFRFNISLVSNFIKKSLRFPDIR